VVRVAKLYYRYGTMNSGKSIDILKTAHNYREQGKTVILFTSPADDRYGEGKITSRIGMQEEALLINENVFDLVEYLMPNCVIVDEVQFCKEEDIDQLAMIVDVLDIPVICYGLMTDFQSKLFEGSKRLLELADRIEEIKTICWYCNSKARFNTRFKDGKAIFVGSQVEIGGNDKYLPLCRKCYIKEQAKQIIWGENDGEQET
jgi:thymidine kinase